MKKLLETTNNIFLIKLWWKFGKVFQKNSQPPPTSHCSDDINMIQIIHRHSNFSSKFLYFFLNPNKKKRTLFLPTFFLHIFFVSTFFFPPNFLKTKWSIKVKHFSKIYSGYKSLLINTDNFYVGREREHLVLNVKLLQVSIYIAHIINFTVI